MITESAVTFAKSGAIVEMEKLRGAWAEMTDDWRAYTGGWCLGYSLKLDQILTRFGVELDDDPELERSLRKRYEQAN